jgi:hypothetical protein
MDTPPLTLLVIVAVGFVAAFYLANGPLASFVPGSPAGTAGAAATS